MHTLCYEEWVRQGRLDINNKEEGAPFAQLQGQTQQLQQRQYYQTILLPICSALHLFLVFRLQRQQQHGTVIIPAVD